MKKIIILFLGLFLISSCAKQEQTKEKTEENERLLNGKHSVVIDIKEYGEIELELDADVAPITVTNFINLVDEGFYDGLTFHRIIEGFMIQGGDPNHNGSGGSAKKIKGEFSKNGIGNTISHERGVISMARSEDYNSASSQFFIVQEDSPHLDRLYAAFGHVTKGMNIIDKIVNDAVPVDDNGTILYEKQPVIKSVKVLK